MFLRTLYSFVVLSLLGLTQCSKNEIQPTKTEPSKEQTRTISTVDVGKSKLVTLQRQSLDKQEYLLQSSLAIQPVVAWTFGLKSRIVKFKKVDNKVHMLDSLEGNTATRALPQTLLLGVFPIVKETDTEVAFDFNAGMQKVYLGEEWYATDFGGDEYAPDIRTVLLKDAYIESAEKLEGDLLVLRQIGNAALGLGGIEMALSLETKYYLQPYVKDTTYTPMVSTGRFDQFGFFEIPPQLIEGKGTAEVMVSRFNTKKPIVYAVSANTPKDYQEAVKAGILYWNQVMGGKYLDVVTAPVGVTAPNPKYNVVQWLDYDEADMAYADAQMDPRTGQILHAQIFMPSVFAFHTKARIRALLNRVREKDDGKKNRKANIVHQFLSKAKQHTMCNMHFHEKVEPALNDLLNSNASDEAILKASQDLVTEVVAHEVGHTLGLRHNFAGSLSTQNYSLSDARKVLTSYLTEGKVDPKIRPTGSVMDYNRTEEGVLVGHLMRKEQAVLEYDKRALQTLYFGASYGKNETPLFCTDTDVMKGLYVDCAPGDGGASIVEFAAEVSRQSFDNLHHDLLQKFLDAKAPLSGKAVPVSEVRINTDAIANRLFAAWKNGVASIGTSKGLLKIRREYTGAPSEDITDIVVPAELKVVSEEFNRLSGGKVDVELVYQVPSADRIADSQKRFLALLNPEVLKTYLSLSGKPVAFTEDELRVIKSKVARFYASLPESLAKGDQSLWKYISNEWKNLKKSPEISQTILKLMQKRVTEYVYATSKTNGQPNTIQAKLKAKVEKKKGGHDEEDPLAPVETVEVEIEVNLPKYAYVAEVRTGAPGLLSAGSGESETWGIREKAEAKNAFKAQTRKALGDKVDLSKVKAGEITVTPAAKLQEVTDWIIENQKVLDAF